MNWKIHIKESRELIARRLYYATGRERTTLMYIDCKLKMAQEPPWRAAICRLCRDFDLGDDETIRGEFGRWPLKFWVVEPEYYGPKPRLARVFPWRIRTALAGLVLDWMFRRCTRCGQKITISELLRRDGYLTRFLSGSACHRDCAARPRDEKDALKP